jgi:hypothetical protein
VIKASAIAKWGQFSRELAPLKITKWGQGGQKSGSVFHARNQPKSGGVVLDCHLALTGPARGSGGGGAGGHRAGKGLHKEVIVVAHPRIVFIGAFHPATRLHRPMKQRSPRMSPARGRVS